MQYFHYDGVKQLNRLNVNGVPMNASPISEIIISQKKNFFFLSHYNIKARGFVNVQTSVLISLNINTCRYERIDHK